MVGQIPIYYSQKNSGKPPSHDNIVHIDDIETRAPQTSLGMSAFHLDTHFTPLFPFGHGLSYARFEYRDIRVSTREIGLDDTVTISADLTNAGDVTADEVVQLYVRDIVANITRPVKELKGFRRVRLEPHQTVTVDFKLHTSDLTFYGRDMRLTVEPGEFHAWIGGSSTTDLRTEFWIVAGK
jgi:beta-glucosidase